MSPEAAGRHSAPHGVPQPGVATYGAGVASPGEILVDRYQLEELVDTDSSGRQVWRGFDTVLRRPVAIIIRQPGGEAAASMLTTAVAASRIVHPHILSVYDAVDEGHRAYLIREWVAGRALRDLLQNGPIGAEGAIRVTHAIAEAVATLHAHGIVHGHVHPGSVLVGDDGRVVLADTPADGRGSAEGDVRALGGVLYASLTGHWPQAEAGRARLVDAVRDSTGRPQAPRQALAGVPRQLDQIAVELLDPRVEPPPAATVASEFAQLANQEGIGEEYDDEYDDAIMGLEDTGGRRRVGAKLTIGIAALVVIALVGIVIGVKSLGGSKQAPDAQGPSTPTATASAAPAPRPITVLPDQVRIVDPPGGDRTELDGVEKTVDGDEQTGWSSDQYASAKFGNFKSGMGVLIDLGAPTKVGSVKVVVNLPGASVSVRTGASDPGNTTDGDGQIDTSYTTVGTPLDDNAGATMVFTVPESQQTMQYVLVWVSQLPATDNGKYKITIDEIYLQTP